MGARLRIDCTVKPSARRPLGRAFAHDGEEGRTRHACPRHHEDNSEEDDRPRGCYSVEYIAHRGECDEDEERAPPSIAIAHPPTGVLIDAIEKVLACPKQADRSRRRAEHLEIFGQEALPEVFAQREQEHCERDGDDIALETERLGDSGAASH